MKAGGSGRVREEESNLSRKREREGVAAGSHENNWIEFRWKDFARFTRRRGSCKGKSDIAPHPPPSSPFTHSYSSLPPFYHPLCRCLRPDNTCGQAARPQSASLEFRNPRRRLFGPSDFSLAVSSSSLPVALLSSVGTSRKHQRLRPLLSPRVGRATSESLRSRPRIRAWMEL